MVYQLRMYCIASGFLIWYYQLSWHSKLAPVKSYKADVSRINPLSELTLETLTL